MSLVAAYKGDLSPLPVIFFELRMSNSLDSEIAHAKKQRSKA